MAGFRIGRGRDNRTPQHRQPQQAPSYGGPATPPSPYGQQQWQQGGQAYGEPEYFGDPHAHPNPQPHPGAHPHAYQQPQQPQYRGGAPGHPADPYAANNPGHTQVFSVHDDPYGQAGPYGPDAAPAAPVGPRLPWKQLLSGIVLRPGPTFWQMRDHAVWIPALTITFLYGLLALFGFDKAREEAINATLSTAVPYVLLTGVMMVIGGVILGVVTHTLARQLGGDGAWQPTVGLSMLIMAMTDAPRLLFALFLGGDNSLVQVVGWLSWLAAGALFTSMVSKSHDLPWPKALGASSIQLVALLSLVKLGTL
ncbi:YIP1 family protein [Streptomyces coeruleoprunus]|uniref:YIP1 family protein n=1 Tax=Streptomyces coeruleoprunus TaxID=285563 RepID=A0ABV9XF30_9ACTN